MVLLIAASIAALPDPLADRAFALNHIFRAACPNDDIASQIAVGGRDGGGGLERECLGETGSGHILGGDVVAGEQT